MQSLRECNSADDLIAAQGQEEYQQILPLNGNQADRRQTHMDELMHRWRNGEISNSEVLIYLSPWLDRAMQESIREVANAIQAAETKEADAMWARIGLEPKP